MKIKVERCLGQNPYFRLHVPICERVERLYIGNPEGGFWDRETAKIALDDLERLYGIPRRKVRFVHLN